MSACGTCGHQSEPGARFCASCGAPLGGGSVELIDDSTTRGSVGATGEVRRDGVPTRWLAVVVGAVAVLGLGWALTRGGPAPVQSSAASTTEPTTTEPATTEPVAEVDSPEPSSTVPDTTGTSELPPPPAGFPEGSQVLKVGDEVPPDPPIGYSAVVPGRGGGMVQIDLDTGQVVKLPFGGVPYALVDGVVLFNGPDGLMRYDPGSPVGEGNPTVLSADMGGFGAPPVVAQDGGVWTALGWDSEGVRWQRFTASGMAEDVVLFSAAPWNFGTSTPDAFSPASGGVYRLRGQSFDRVADGAVTAVAIDRVLVSTCDATLMCTFGWLSLPEFEPLDLAVPDPSPETWEYYLDPTGRWLFSNGSSGSEVFDTATGETSPAGCQQWNCSVTPDGAWSVRLRSNNLQLQRLGTGETRRLTGFLSGVGDDGAAPVLVPTPTS